MGYEYFVKRKRFRKTERGQRWHSTLVLAILMFSFYSLPLLPPLPPSIGLLMMAS